MGLLKELLSSLAKQEDRSLNKACVSKCFVIAVKGGLSEREYDCRTKSALETLLSNRKGIGLEDLKVAMSSDGFLIYIRLTISEPIEDNDEFNRELIRLLLQNGIEIN